VDVIFRGRLSNEVRLSQVLEHVRESKTKGVTLLFLRSTDQAIEGVVSIWNARFITSAQLYRASSSDYSAIKQLFALTEGDFAYGKPEAEEIEGLEHVLNIELKSIIPLLPFLPESVSALIEKDQLAENLLVTTGQNNRLSKINTEPDHSTGKGSLGTIVTILTFWTRTDILIVITALITSVCLLWLCEKIAPYVESQLKTTKPFHLNLPLPTKG
jgi:hypothetical protein